MNLRRYVCSIKSVSIVFGLALLVALFAAQSVSAQSNPTAEENEEEGTTAWQIDPEDAALEREIEGYASATSVNVGSTIKFYVSGDEQTIDIEIYRMGYYGGTGGRLITVLEDKEVELQDLPEADHTTGLIECDWEETAQWMPPSGTISGYYIAKLVGEKQSYIIFVVRQDGRDSDFVFQSAVTTYQAYNNFPGDQDDNISDPPIPNWESGKSLYNDNGFGPLIPDDIYASGRNKQARMVSFNRPYGVVDGYITTTAGHFFQWEYRMVYWMESEELDVSYITNIDTHDNASNFDAGEHKAFLTAGHDEYYSWEMRDNLQQARDRSTEPMHLGFFSSNDSYWQIRLANSSSSNTTPANAPYRTIICYKLHVNDGDYGDPNRVNDFFFAPVLTDNHLITQKWRDNRTYEESCPGGGTACYKDPEDEFIGAMTDEDFITGAGAFTFHKDCPEWIRDGFSSSSLRSLIAYEPVRVFGSYPNRTFYMVGDSEVERTDPLQVKIYGPAQSVYYKMDTGGRVFSAGSNDWATKFEDLSIGSDVATMTMNILDCFKNSGGDCGE
jgi:hypothetical protein